MGSSSSKTVTTNENNQTYITNNDIKVLNEMTNNAVAEALIKNNSDCSSTTDITQTIDFSGCKVTGDVNITNVKQKAAATVNFSCVNVFKAEQQMAQEMLSSLMGEIMSALDAESLNRMATAAETSAQSTGVFGGNSSSSTTTNNIYNLEQITNTETNIQNILANNINASFDVESVQTCESNLAVKQEFLMSKCEVGGSINMSEYTQVADISNMTECLNQSGVSQEIINKSANELGVIVETDNTIHSDSSQESDVSTSSFSGGLLGFSANCPCPGCGTMGCMIALIIICALIVLAVLAYCYMSM